MDVCKLNKYDRLVCDGIEFGSGSVVEVYLNGTWWKTRIEYASGQYFSIDDLPLLGNPVRTYTSYE